VNSIPLFFSKAWTIWSLCPIVTKEPILDFKYGCATAFHLLFQTLSPNVLSPPNVYCPSPTYDPNIFFGYFSLDLFPFLMAELPQCPPSFLSLLPLKGFFTFFFCFSSSLCILSFCIFCCSSSSCFSPIRKLQANFPFNLVLLALAFSYRRFACGYAANPPTPFPPHENPPSQFPHFQILPPVLVEVFFRTPGSSSR